MLTYLLANLGNRNIIYKGKTYPDFGPEMKDEYGSFRHWTKNLLDNWESKRNFVNLNILNTLLDKTIVGVDKIILYYSDQAEETDNDQDTLYEAEIVKKLIQDQYKFENIGLIKVEGSVVNNETLLKFYKSQLKKIYSSPKTLIKICDAGGTAQQKSALKIIAEFLLPEGSYELYYVNIKSCDIVIDKQDEYRKIILYEQAINLIQHGHFAAAANLLGIDVENAKKLPSSKWREKVFSHVVHRFQGKIGHAVSDINIEIKNPILLEFKNGNALSLNNELRAFWGKQFLSISEKLYKAIFLYNIRNYTESILAYSQFYESAFQESICLYLDSDIYGKPWNPENTDLQKENVENLVKRDYSNYINKNTKFKCDIGSLSTQALILKKCTIKSVEAIATILSPHIDYTDNANKDELINKERNRIAHDGLNVTLKDINERISYYPLLLTQSKEILQLSSNDLFKELADILEKNLRL